MGVWLVVKDDTIVDIIVADSKEYVEETFSTEVLPNDGIKGVGWTRSSGSWQAPYPTDGLEYIWDDQIKRWRLKPPTPKENTFIIEG